MAQEASPGYKLFAVKPEEATTRLVRILTMLGVKTDVIKTADLKLLMAGWTDGLSGREQAMQHPQDQTVSLVPAALRGFHRLASPEGDMEGESEGGLVAGAAKWKKAVAMVRVKNRRGEEGHGTGFFIAPGLLLTNQHVIDEALQIEVVVDVDASEHRATVVSSMEVPDVALLRIDLTTHETLTLGNSDKVRELDDVVLIGYPKFSNLSATVVRGSISSTEREFEGYSVLQVSIPSYGGNSGGPLINTRGEVIGIHTFSLSDPSLSQFKMAQRINSVLDFLDDAARGKYKRAL
jgi:S1-C subfamily serine protease